MCIFLPFGIGIGFCMRWCGSLVFGVWALYVELDHKHMLELYVEVWDWESVVLIIDAKYIHVWHFFSEFVKLR